MKTVTLLFCLWLPLVIGNKHFESRQLKAGDTMNIWPTTNVCHTESRWNLEACDGCKIVLTCALFRRNCADHIVTVFNGKWTSRHCGPGESYLYKTSLKNWMNVIIENNGLKPGSYCHVSVTKPYYNSKYITADSSEHGLGTGARRQPTCKCGWANKNPGRIIGGKETSPNEYPFAVLLMLKKRGIPFCGGSIISPYHVLTAAHCTHPFHGMQLSVIVGEHDVTTDQDTKFTKIMDVDMVYDHPDYNNHTNTYDLSILKLKRKIIFNEAVGPVCLPEGPHYGLLNEYVKVLGWGHTRNKQPSPSLQKANMKVIDLDICQTIYGSIDTQKRTQICTWAPTEDTCQGDSGGPVIWRDPESNRFTLVGIVSFVRECGHTDPSVNTDISAFIDWIKLKVAESGLGDICH